jgi:hypothetical protein
MSDPAGHAAGDPGDGAAGRPVGDGPDDGAGGTVADGTVADGTVDQAGPADDRISVWTLLAWVTALSGPLAYALGRVVVETFYSRFDVLPAEVGLGYDSLVAPAILVMVGTAAAGLLLIALGRAVLAFGGAVVLFTVIHFVTTDSLHSWRAAGSIGLALLAMGGLAVLGTLEGSFGRPVWIALLAAGAVGVATMALVSASSAADDAQAGRAVAVRVLGLPISAIRATPVRLGGIAASDRPSRTSCVLLLGSADGVAVVLDDGVVWRLPADETVTTTDC